MGGQTEPAGHPALKGIRVPETLFERASLQGSGIKETCFLKERIGLVDVEISPTLGSVQIDVEGIEFMPGSIIHPFLNQGGSLHGSYRCMVVAAAEEFAKHGYALGVGP